MNRTFATVCLSLLAAMAVPCVIVTSIGLWMADPHVWRMGLETFPLSFMLGGLTVFFWLCGPPKPTRLIETIGRWFLALLMPTGMAFIATALGPLLDTTVNHTQFSTQQTFWVEFHSLWGLVCGVSAGVVLQYRELVVRVDAPKVGDTRCQCQK